MIKHPVTDVAHRMRDAVAPLLESLTDSEYDIYDEFLDVGEEGLAIEGYRFLAEKHGFTLPVQVLEAAEPYTHL